MKGIEGQGELVQGAKPSDGLMGEGIPGTYKKAEGLNGNGVRPARDESTELRRAVTDELFDAWRTHVDRIEQQMQSGWQERIQGIVEQRLNDLSNRLSSEHEHRLKEATTTARRTALEEARHDTSERLHRAVHPLTRAGTRAAWLSALADAAGWYAERVAILTLRDGEGPLSALALDLDFDSGKALPSEPVPLCYAPALLSAMESGMPVVAVRSGAEISVALENMLGPGAARARVFPLVAQGRAFGVLYTEGATDGNALDLIANVASLAAAASRDILRQTTFERPAAVNASPRPALWNDLPVQDQELHLKAHRFARTQAAQLRLYRSQEVREGRAAGQLYEMLREPIDEARRAYQEQFMVGCESMVDYLHNELVKTLANNDERLLGGAYPGPLHC